MSAHPMAGETFTADDMESIRNLGIAHGLVLAAEAIEGTEFIDRGPAIDRAPLNFEDFRNILMGTIQQMGKHLRETAAHYRGEDHV